MQKKTVLEKILSAYSFLQGLKRAAPQFSQDWGRHDFIDHKKRSLAAKEAKLILDVTLEKMHRRSLENRYNLPQ